MVRYGNLYEKVYEIKNIRLAHENAKKGKSHYSEVKMVDANPDYYLNNIIEMLKNRIFRNSEYEVFIKYDGRKEREIYKLPYYPDRIIHHAIMQIVEPIWFKTLIRDTYSSIKGRGIHDGVKRIQKALRDKEGTKYCLKMDVKKFYPSVNNEILKRIVRLKIKDVKLLWLLDEIINSTEGLPIGNYLSQYFGNIYLSGLDHWAKEKKGFKYYYRYCDDVVILHSEKIVLHKLREDVSKYLVDLNLKLKDNWQVYPVDGRGIDFLGYRFFHDFTLLRKTIKMNFIRKVSEIKRRWGNIPNSIIINGTMSYCGWMKYANTKNLMNKYFDGKLFWIMKQTCRESHINNPLQGI